MAVLLLNNVIDVDLQISNAELIAINTWKTIVWLTHGKQLCG